MFTLREGSSGNYYGSLYGEKSSPLGLEQMKVNAIYIYTYLSKEGWSKNAISAMLGNMQAESTINPGRWQNDTISSSLGFGLVQWTPSTKYTDWCRSNGLSDPSVMDNNLKHLLYELENNLQWIATNSYNLSFKEFSKSDASVEDLAKAFLLNYERPADQSEEVKNYRAELALNWYSLLNGENPDIPVNPDNPEVIHSAKKKKYNFIIFQANRRRNQWIRNR